MTTHEVELLINVGLLTLAHTFWLFALCWENEQRRKEAQGDE